MMEQAELLVSRQGGLGCVRLNRPRALNSLTLAMVRAFTAALSDFGRDPAIIAVLVTGEGDRGLCAGGDIRALYNLRGSDKSDFRVFWREEYELNARIADFEKLYIVVMDGLVMGGGVGISAHGNNRIVTERTKLAMPETCIGFIPDVGGTWLLSRAGAVGAYMALSGVTVSGADAVAAGLADRAMDSRRIPELVLCLQEIGSADEALETLSDFSQPLDAGELSAQRETLERAMSGVTVEEILAGLASQGSDFARAAASEIAAQSPTSLKVTQALLRAAADSDTLQECLVREYRAACSLLGTHDLYEGIRAAIIDKDRAPHWRPPTLAEVSEARVAEILKGDGSQEPSFARNA